MVTDRRDAPGRMILLAAALAVLAAPEASPAADGEGRPVRLTESAERGAFNVKAAQGAVAVVADPDAGGDVLKLDYTVPPGTAVGVWTKGFPASLADGGVEVVRPMVRAADPESIRRVAVALEIKGSAGVQRIPLAARPGQGIPASNTP